MDGKGLILLSDDYVAAHDDFQAKHTLNTVIENASDTAITGEAKRKMEKIEESKKPVTPQPAKTDTIQFNNNKSDNKLFKQQ